jgi:hypothetical protein
MYFELLKNCGNDKIYNNFIFIFFLFKVAPKGGGKNATLSKPSKSSSMNLKESEDRLY